MMTRLFAVLGVVTLSACAYEIPDFRTGMSAAPTPVAAPVVRPMSATDRFVAAAAANGCVVDSTTSGPILTQATLSREDMARIMTELRASGQGVIAADGASFRVMTGACA
ncbi:MAG: hypothetical protein ACSHW1_05760 [Yoonia sp.]|uniref:hypothetical protein n=1 Tax=Yoonia sp. TaxID=2212373 RepID=UPI003EF7105F